MYNEAAVLREWENKWLDPDYDFASGRYDRQAVEEDEEEEDDY